MGASNKRGDGTILPLSLDGYVALAGSVVAIVVRRECNFLGLLFLSPEHTLNQ